MLVKWIFDVVPRSTSKTNIPFGLRSGRGTPHSPVYGWKDGLLKEAIYNLSDLSISEGSCTKGGMITTHAGRFVILVPRRDHTSAIKHVHGEVGTAPIDEPRCWVRWDTAATAFSKRQRHSCYWCNAERIKLDLADLLSHTNFQRSHVP
eukprot:5737929-Amphidinium_carterae.1